jgi:hypothetical protein
VKWEVVDDDFTDANLDGLFLESGSNILWGFKADDSWYYEDTLTGKVTLSAPGDGSSSERLDSAELSWQELDGAVYYQILVDTDPGFKGTRYADETTKLTSLRVTGLEDGRTYYWKVRVAQGEPVWSNYSEVWEFTTAMGAAEWNPFTGGIPEAPYNGATNVPLRPSFAWNAADWAVGYEFVLAKDPNFTEPIVSKTGANALTATVYLSEEELDYSTTYYWKVRAISKTTNSEWAQGVFTTLAEPAEPPPPPPTPTPPPPPTTPSYIWVIIGIGAALVIAVIILIVRTRRVA